MTRDTRSSPSPLRPEAPHLITRPHAEVGVAAAPVGIRGRFGFEKIHARTGLVTQSGSFDNLITDAGLNALGTTMMSNLVEYVAVGTGSTAPAFADVQLQAEVGRTNASGGFTNAYGYDTTDPAKPFHWYRKVFLFTEAQANGNLTELGLFNAAGGGILWNRQLFRDANGNPTVITKTADEQLKLFYEWRLYPPIVATTQVINVKGVDVVVSNRGYQVNNVNVWGGTGFGFLLHFGLWDFRGFLYESNSMPGLTTNQSGSAHSDSTRTVSAYVQGSHHRDAELRWDPSAANTPSGMVGSLTIRTWSPEQFISTFNPRLSKTVNDRVVIQARIAWERATI